jgi:hypothetical protein
MDPRWACLKKRLILRKGEGEYKREGGGREEVRTQECNGAAGNLRAYFTMYVI